MKADQLEKNPGNWSSETLLNNILKSIPDRISVVDKDFRIIFSNWQGGHGYVSTKMRRRKSHCYVANYPGRTTPCDDCHVLEVFRNGTPVIREKFNSLAGHVEIRAYPLFDDKGTVSMVLENVRNIDKRKKAEESLKQANQMLQAVIQASPLPIVVLDNEESVKIWNPAAESTFGWKAEEVLGRKYPLLPEDRKEEFEAIFQSFKEGATLNGAELLRKKNDGTIIPIRSYTAPLYDEKKGVIATMGILEDISESKRSEEALREANRMLQTTIQASPLPIVVLDDDANVKLWNPAAENTFGWKAEEVIDKLYPLVPDEGIDEFCEILKQMNEGKVFTEVETLRKKKDGTIIPVSLSTALLRDEKGSIVGNMMVLVDLTEHKRTEEENRKIQAGLLQTNKMTAIGILASGIAHEINNPNNYILSNAQFLSDVWPCVVSILANYAKEHGEFYLGKISFTEASAFMPKILGGLIDGAHRINTIINNLKNFARDEKQHHDQLVDVNKAIHVSLSMLKNEIGKYTDHFFCALEKDLPSIRGSFQQLEQVIVNLVMNALQALPDRNHGIFMSTMFEKSLGQIIIKVRDEGIGMTEDVQKYIFDPFFTTKLDSGGTGLGLSICFTIVKEHQGTIECESAPDKGTTFLLKIPAANNHL